MSRYDAHDETRGDATRGRPRDDHLEALRRTLSLPGGEEREVVAGRDRTYQLNGADGRILATVGAFRVVAVDDLGTGRSGKTWTTALRPLADQGLVDRKSVVLHRKATSVVLLTPEAKQLLDAHQLGRGSDRQEFYAGLVTPRALSHDAQLFRVYRAEGTQIDACGGRVERVVLEHQLKRAYGQYLNRPHGPHPTDVEARTWAFGASHKLPIVNGHLAVPDLRIEYLDEDGRLTRRDIELVTEHYSRSQIASKGRAGFVCHRM